MEKTEEINSDDLSTQNLNKKITDIISKNKFNITNNYDLQKELLFFKNDILKDMRNLEAKQAEKLINFKEEQTKIFNKYETKFLEQSEKITYLSNMIVDYFRKEKFESYFEEFKKKLEKNFAEMATKIYSLQGELKDVLYQQEKYFKENVLYPGVIGYQCKFKDLHAFIDYVLESIEQIEIYQETIKGYELHKIRKNLESDLNTIQSKLKTNFQILTKFTTEKVNESEQKMLKVLNDYNSQFVDVRIENNKNADNLMKKMEEVEHNFDQIIKIRKEMNQKNKEQDQKLENIIQNIADNEIRIIEQNKEINNVDKKFNLLTTYIDNQNEDNYNTQYNSIIARNFVSNKYLIPKRIKSAREFINRQMKKISEEEKYIYENDNSNKTLNKTGYNYGAIDNNNHKNFINYINYNKNFRTINNNIYPRKSFVTNKKMIVKGDSFIKRYISGKISINDMYNHQKDLNKEKNEINNETPPKRKIKYFSPINDRSKIFDLTKLQSKENIKDNNLRKNKPKKLNINNNNFGNNKYITKSLSDGNYNYPNTKLMSHENFKKEINETLNKRHKNNQFFLVPYNNQKTSNNFIEQQLFKDKRFNNALPKKRKKLLIIQ